MHHRQPHEAPAWVTHALLTDFARIGNEPGLAGASWMPKLTVGRSRNIWDPAAGHRAVADVLRAAGYSVTATDPVASFGVKPNDFLADPYVPHETAWIISHPPLKTASGDVMAFIERGLDVIRERDGLMALLLPAAFDASKSRAHVFGACLEFKRKLILTDLIEFSDRTAANAQIKRDNAARKAAGQALQKMIPPPALRHAWYVWNANLALMRPRTLGYGGKPAVTTGQKQFSAATSGEKVGA